EILQPLPTRIKVVVDAVDYEHYEENLETKFIVGQELTQEIRLRTKPSQENAPTPHMPPKTKGNEARPRVSVPNDYENATTPTPSVRTVPSHPSTPIAATGSNASPEKCISNESSDFCIVISLSQATYR